MVSLIESVVEDAALRWPASLGYAVLHGPDIASGELGAESDDPNYHDLVSYPVCARRWCASIPNCPQKLLKMPTACLPEFGAAAKLTRTDALSLLERILAVELLQKLLKNEITLRAKRNGVQAHPFAGLLKQARFHLHWSTLSKEPENFDNTPLRKARHEPENQRTAG